MRLVKNWLKKWMQRSIKSAPTHPNNRLKTRFIKAQDLTSAVGVSAKTFTILPRARVLNLEIDQGLIEAERVWFGPFVSDISVLVSPGKAGFFAINIESTTRRGPAFLGQNTRNIEDYYDQLDKAVQAFKEVDLI